MTTADDAVEYVGTGSVDDVFVPPTPIAPAGYMQVWTVTFQAVARDAATEGRPSGQRTHKPIVIYAGLQTTYDSDGNVVDAVVIPEEIIILE